MIMPGDRAAEPARPCPGSCNAAKTSYLRLDVKSIDRRWGSACSCACGAIAEQSGGRALADSFENVC